MRQTDDEFFGINNLGHMCMLAKLFFCSMILWLQINVYAGTFAVRDYVTGGMSVHQITATNLCRNFHDCGTNITIDICLVGAKKNPEGQVDFSKIIMLQDKRKNIKTGLKQVLCNFDDGPPSVTEVNGGGDVIFFHDTKKLFDTLCVSKHLRVMYPRKDDLYQVVEFELSELIHEVEFYVQTIRDADPKAQGLQYATTNLCASIVCGQKEDMGKIRLYDDVISSFTVSNVNLWLDSPLYKKIAKLQEGTCSVITAESWASNKSVLVYSCDSRSCLMISCEGEMTTVSKDEFKHYCSSASLVSYGKKVCLNIPKSHFVNDQECCLGQLLAGDVFAITFDVTGKVPSQEVRVIFSIPNFFDVPLGVHVLAYRIPNASIFEAVRKKRQTQITTAWKRKHAALVARLPRKPRVVYGSSKMIVKRMDDTFEIPYEKPPTTKTIYWTENVYADAWGETESGERIHMSVPVGQRECSRTKKLTQMYDYDALKIQLEEYNALKDEIKNDRPEIVDESEVQDLMSQGFLIFEKIRK